MDLPLLPAHKGKDFHSSMQKYPDMNDFHTLQSNHHVFFHLLMHQFLHVSYEQREYSFLHSDAGSRKYLYHVSFIFFLFLSNHDLCFRQSTELILLICMTGKYKCHRHWSDSSDIHHDHQHNMTDITKRWRQICCQTYRRHC